MTCSHKIEANVEIEDIRDKVENRNFEHPFMPLEFYYDDGHRGYDLEENPSRQLDGYEDQTWNCPNKAEDNEKCPYHSEESDLEDRIDRLYEDLQEDTEEPLIVVDSEFPEMDLSETNVNRPVIITNCEFSSCLNICASMEHNFIISNCDIKGDVEIDISHKEIDESSDVMSLTASTVDSKMEFLSNVEHNVLNFTSSKFEGSVSCGDGVSINSEINFSGSLLNNGVEFQNTSFDKPAIFLNTEFSNSLADFDDVDFHGSANFKYADFNHRVQFKGADFNRGARFSYSNFQKSVWFTYIDFGGRVQFRNTVFQREAYFIDSKFQSTVDFNRAEFKCGASFLDMDFKNEIRFSEAFFGHNSSKTQKRFICGRCKRDVFLDSYGGRRCPYCGTGYIVRDDCSMIIFDTEFHNKSYCKNSIFKSDVRFRLTESEMTWMFKGCDIDEDLTFKNAEFSETLQLTNMNINGSLIIRDINKLNMKTENPDGLCADILGVELSGSLKNTKFDSGSELVDCTLHDMHLEGADFRFCGLKGTDFDRVRIDDKTKFLQNSSNQNNTRYRKLRSKILQPALYRYEDPYSNLDQDSTSLKDSPTSSLTRRINQNSGRRISYEKRLKNEIDNAKTIYQKIEIMARDSSRPQLLSEAFIRRQSLNAKQYRSDVLNHNLENVPNLTALTKWIRATTSKWILLYGESPWRIVGWSALIVFVCGIIYQYFDLVEPAPNGIAEAMYYSSLIYTSLGFGSFNPVGLGKYIAAFQTLFGLVMLALLVFVLGRRAAR